MRFSTAIVFAAASSLVAAQLGSLPKCAQDCFGNSLGSCGQLDIGCICGNQTLISSLSCCVYKTCSTSEQDSIIKTAAALCKANGVDVPTSASCASTASSTSAPSSSASGGSTSMSMSSGSGAMTTLSSGGAAGQSSQTAAAVPIATAGLKAGAGMGLAMGVAGLLVGL